MHPRLSQSHGKLLIALSLVILAAGMAPAWGDDTGILGRLFRLGGGSSDSSPSTARTEPIRISSLWPRCRLDGQRRSADRDLSAGAGADDLEL